MEAEVEEKVSEGRQGIFLPASRLVGNYGTMETSQQTLGATGASLSTGRTGTKTFVYFLKWTSDSQSAWQAVPFHFHAIEEQLD